MDPEVTQIIKLTEENIKTLTLTVFHMFKKLNGDREIQKRPNQNFWK